MITKLFEIRDVCTNISAIAIKLGKEESIAENGILAHGGWSSYPESRWDRNYVILIKITGGANECHNCPEGWDDSRTMGEAHHYLKKHFDELRSGDIIDIPYILGETKEKVTTDNLTNF